MNNRICRTTNLAGGLCALLFLLLSPGAEAKKRAKFTEGVTVALEVSGTAGSGTFAPLWLAANTQGKQSALQNSGYERVLLARSMDADSLGKWRLGYGIDLMARQHNQSVLLPHQAYFEAAWKKIGFVLGAKERVADLKNNELSSGGLSLGINATPIPMARIEVDYFTIPGTKGWWQWKARMGYGMTTDGRWQKRWIGDPATMRYSTNFLYHEKALYWKLGRQDKFPLTYQIGLQMMAQFGGTVYNVDNRGVTGTLKNPHNFNAFWHAFQPVGSSDATDGAIKNSAGNTLGSYNMRLQWAQKDWSVAAYFERFFEDQSMLVVQYGIYDHIIGVDAQLPKNRYVSHVVGEHLSTRDQSGPVYHDMTGNMPYHIAGIDNYYNHHLFPGWQHWGNAIGNPLLTSPVYNASAHSGHEFGFRNNRVMAWHFGIDGDPCPEVHWRAMLTFTRNWGTYYVPYPDVKKEQHYLAEATYLPRWAKGWQGTLALGVTHGQIMGNSFGAQLTLRKTFHL